MKIVSREEIIELSKTMTRDEIREYYGLPYSTMYSKAKNLGLKKWGKPIRIGAWNRKYDDKTIRKVIDEWLLTGMVGAQEKFPELNVNSIISCYAHKGGNCYGKFKIGSTFKERYSFKEKLFLIRYYTILGRKICEKKLFKKFIDRKNIFFNNFADPNGFRYDMCKHVVLPECAEMTYKHGHARNYLSWQDIEKWICVDNQDLIKLAQSMAKYQRWIHRNNIIFNKDEICKTFKKMQKTHS